MRRGNSLGHSFGPIRHPAHHTYCCVGVFEFLIVPGTAATAAEVASMTIDGTSSDPLPETGSIVDPSKFPLPHQWLVSRQISQLTALPNYDEEVDSEFTG